MKRVYVAGIIIIITIFIQSLHAQEKLSVRNAVSKALESNNTYKSQQSRVAETQAQLDEQWGALWPSIASDASYARLGADSGNTKNIDAQYNINIINSTITINPGSVYNSIMAARDNRIIAENNLRVTRSNIEKSTIELFYNLILARETVKIQTESNNSLRENLKTVTAGYNHGRTSRLDYLTAKLTLTNSDTDLINAQSDAERTLALLNINLGNNINTKIDPDDTFRDIPSDEKEIMTLKNDQKDEFINNLVSESLKNRPELITKKKAISQYDYNQGIQSATYIWPSFFVNGKYTESKNELSPGTSSSSSLTDKWTNSWSIMFGASYKWGALAPLDPSHARERQQVEKKKQAQYDLEDFVKQVNLDVIQNYLSMKAAFNSILAQKENVSIAEENMKAAQIQFKSGVIDNNKLLDANVRLITTKKNYIQSLVSYSIAKSALNNVIGMEMFSLY
jgi:outer membrane protein, multidrug efflux system